MIFSKAFKDFMATGKKPTEAIAEDESLAEHDKKYHGGHFDQKTQSCGKRQASEKNDKIDKVTKKATKAERAEMVKGLLDKFKYKSRFGGLVTYEQNGFWDDNELRISGTYENGSVGASNAPISRELAQKMFAEIKRKFPVESWSLDRDNTLRINGKFSSEDVISEDATPDLQRHDARFHGGHYDGKGECKYREALAKGDKADALEKAEREEDKTAGEKYVPTDAEIDEAAKKVSDAYDFDINGVKDNIKTLLEGKKVYGNATGNLFDIINANRGGGVVRAIRDRADEQGLDDYWVKKLNEYVDGKEKKENAENVASPQDYADLEDIRQKVEAAARLLNGRAGNLQALQASRRWPLLDSISGDKQIAADLRRLQKSNDPAVSGQANDLWSVLSDIADRKFNGWKQGVGMVPAALNGPQGAAANNQQPASSNQFSVDDAKAILGRVAKSINHHIDTGDFTPNAGAVSKYQAAKAQIAALKDPQLDKFCQEIDASLAAGNQKKVSKVPAPSQAWQQAHAPQMPAGGLGGLLGALMGARSGGHGGGAPKGPVKKGSLSGQTLTPFMAPSPWASQIQAINANHPANSNPDWYKDEADKLTPQQAISQMESNGDIVKGGFRDAYDPNDPDDQELWAGWKPSKKLSDDTAKMAAVVFADLKKRFPGLKAKWKNNMELRCGTKAFTGGQSVHTASWSKHAVLWNCEYGNIWGGVGLGKSNYGHNDNRFFRDVLSHELGHALMSDMLPNGKRKMSLFHKVLNDNWGDDAKELWAWGAKYLSSYSVTNKGNGPSAAEFLAESVSLFSSPDYAPGFLPEPIETFIATEIFGMQKPNTP